MKPFRKSPYFIPLLFLLIFLLAVTVEQGVSYYRLRSQIGKHAYAIVYALLVVGKQQQYIGKVVDVKWNALPDREEDMIGIQPRVLLARETINGTTETRWYSSYLFEMRDEPPETFTPSPFPAYRLLEINP